MFVTFGEKLYGAVDRVPGHFYVATPFLFFCEVPLFPGRSYLVIDGSQVDPALFRKGSFSGYSIYWSFKSIAMAWFRAWLGLLSLAAAITALIGYTAYYHDHKGIDYLYTAWGATAAIFLFLISYLISLLFGRSNPRRLAAMARSLEGKYPKAALVVQTYLKENGLDSETAQNDQD